MRADVRRPRVTWPCACLVATAWLGAVVPAPAQTGADVEAVVAIAAAAVRATFGGDAAVILSEPVLSLTGEAALVARAVAEPASRSAGPVRFVLYTAGERPAERVGRLTARVDVAATHVRARQRLPLRSVLTGDDLEVVHGDIGRQVLRALPPIAAVTGAATRKTLRRGEVITSLALARRDLVRSGEQVVTVARIGAVEVRGRAIAAQSGGLGETVIVVNADSRRRLRARIVAGALVEVLHGS